jgi:hypothetical protein
MSELSNFVLAMGRDFVALSRAFRTRPLPLEKIRLISDKWPMILISENDVLGSETSFKAALDTAAEALAYQSILAQEGLVSTLSQLRTIIKKIQKDGSHRLTAQAETVSDFIEAFMLGPTPALDPAARGLEIIQESLSHANRALVELNPQRDLGAVGSSDSVFTGPSLSAHIAPDVTTFSQTARCDLGVVIADVQPTACVPCISGYGNRIVFANDNAGTISADWLLSRSDITKDVEIEFIAKRYSTNDDEKFLLLDVSAAAGDVEVDDYAKETQAAALANAKAITIGGNAPVSVNVVQHGKMNVATAIFHVENNASNITAVVPKSGVAGDFAFVEIEPMLVRYADRAELGYDSNGNAISGKQLVQLIGTIHPGSYKQCGFSDSTLKLLSALAAYDDAYLLGNGWGGSSSTLSYYMDLINQKRFSGAAGAYDANHWFSLPSMLSDNSANSAKLYQEWYNRLRSFISQVSIDTGLAEAIAAQNQSVVIYE